MSRQTILVVDDEKSLRDFVRRNLEVRGFNVVTAGNGLEALGHFSGQQIDLVILDLMMPHMDGLETIRRIRQQSLVPIIVLSALGEENDKVQAFHLGGDDYLTKPFGVPELMARVQAVLRRTNWTAVEESKEAQLVQGEFRVDFSMHTILMRGEPLELTPTEFNLLVYLIENAGKVLAHRLILQHVWGREYGQEAEYLRVYMGRLRQKIEEDPSQPKRLITERGIGYRFDVQ